MKTAKTCLKNFTIIPLLTSAFLLLFSFATLQAAEYPWQLKKNTDGITVYTRKVEGSPILEFKASVTVDAPIDKVIALFEDEKRMTEWYYQCVRFELVDNENPTKKIFYFVIHLPWPVTERDSVFRRTKSTDPATKSVSYTLTALPDRLPRDKEKIRVLELKSMWRITPLSDEKTELYIQQHSNPGGIIPSFVVNSLVVDIPFHSLKNFRKLLSSTKGP